MIAMPGRTALRSQMRQSGNMDSKELWSSTRDRLVTAVTALGYPEELGHEIAKHIGAPKGMERMISYLNYVRPKTPIFR